MIKEFQGTNGSVNDRSFAIVVSRYHNSNTSNLLDGAVQTLTRNQVPEDNIHVIWVPGAWEIPFAAQQALQHLQLDAIIGLGCVIRGETTHDLHINTTVSNALGQLGMDYGVPVAFGVLTCNTMDQAIQRAGGDVGNKGIEAAEAVIEMLQLFNDLQAANDEPI